MVWYEWYPKLKNTLDSVLVRYVFVGLTFLAGVYGYIQARHYLNTLTGVEPSNFPTTLLTFTAIAILTAWIMLIGVCGALCSITYMFQLGTASALQSQERTVPLGRWFIEWLAETGRDIVRLFGPLAIFFACFNTLANYEKLKEG
jgi:TRAP-type C4-dicarboxylate transport system permease small subunit